MWSLITDLVTLVSEKFSLGKNKFGFDFTYDKQGKNLYVAVDKNSASTGKMTGSSILQYATSSNFSPENLTLKHTFNVTESSSNFGPGLTILNIEFSSDGKTLFILFMKTIKYADDHSFYATNNTKGKMPIMGAYSLTVPFDLSSCDGVISPTNQLDIGFFVTNTNSNNTLFADKEHRTISKFTFSNDGKKMVCIGLRGTTSGTQAIASGYFTEIYSFDLSTAYDLSSIAPSPETFTLPTLNGTFVATDVSFSKNGKDMYVLASELSNFVRKNPLRKLKASLFRYGLSDPYSVSTAVLSGSYKVPVERTNIAARFFAGNNNLTLLGGNILKQSIFLYLGKVFEADPVIRRLNVYSMTNRVIRTDQGNLPFNNIKVGVNTINNAIINMIIPVKQEDGNVKHAIVLGEKGAYVSSMTIETSDGPILSQTDNHPIPEIYYTVFVENKNMTQKEKTETLNNYVQTYSADKEILLFLEGYVGNIV